MIAGGVAGVTSPASAAGSLSAAWGTGAANTGRSMHSTIVAAAAVRNLG